MVLKPAAAHAHVMSDIFILLKTQTPSRIIGGICQVCSIWSLPTFDFTRDIYIYICIYTLDIPWIMLQNQWIFVGFVNEPMENTLRNMA